MPHLGRTPTFDDRYVYAAELDHVVDGDTVVLDIDLGCGMWLHGEHCGLFGISALGKCGDNGLRGLKSSAHLEFVLRDYDAMLVRTHKDERGVSGRWLVELWADGVDINRRMVADGYATER